MKKNIKRLDSLKRNILILLVCWTVGLLVVLFAYISTKNNNITKKLTSNANSHMNIYAIDVRGNAVLLESGGNFILMDTGYKDSEDTVVNFVNKKISKSKMRGEFKSFSLYITEFDKGYIGEVEDVFNKIHVDSIYIQEKKVIEAAKAQTEDYKKLVKSYDNIVNLAGKETEVVELKRGMEVVFGDAKITVLAPFDDVNIKDYEKYTNGLDKYIGDTSLVSIITVGETKYLSTGDISSKIEKQLADEYADNLNAEIYKISNYGSNSSNTVDFLKYINPDYAIKAYNKKNDNSDTDALSRVMYYGCVYNTNFNGNIQFSVMNDNVSIYPDKNFVKLNVYYETNEGMELANKTYNISRHNTLTDKWDFFMRHFDGYETENVQYGKSLVNITSSSYGVDSFRGIKDINNSLDIVVVYDEIKPKGITLNSASVKLDVDDTVDINAVLSPANAKSSKLIWKSDDERIASVKDGKIKGERTGKTRVTVRIKGTSIVASCDVIVGDYDPTIDGFSLSVKSLIIDKNTSINLNYYEGNDNISWAINNPEIAIIDSNGTLTPLKTGTTVVTASFNGYNDRCKITVADNLVLSNIVEKTTVSDMINKMKLTDAKVLNSYAKYKNPDDVVSTGDALVTIDGNKTTLYSIAVVGDINGEGQVNEDDVLLLKEYLKGNKKLSKSAVKASDVNIDGKVNSKDLKILTNYVKQLKGYEKLPYRKK